MSSFFLSENNNLTLSQGNILNMEKQGKKIEDIDQLLAMAGSNLNILEEEVDIKVQKEYFEMLNSLAREISMTFLTKTLPWKSKKECWSFSPHWTK